jgi:hypothetical protein
MIVLLDPAQLVGAIELLTTPSGHVLAKHSVE